MVVDVEELSGMRKVRVRFLEIKHSVFLTDVFTLLCMYKMKFNIYRLFQRVTKENESTAMLKLCVEL